MVDMVTVRVIAHRSVREHSVMRVNIDRALLDSPLWFDEDGEPTKKLYDWAVRQGSTLECDYTDFEDDEDLVIEADVVPDLPTRLGAVVTDARQSVRYLRVWDRSTDALTTRAEWYCEKTGASLWDRDIIEVLAHGGKVLSEGLAPRVSGNGGEES